MVPPSHSSRPTSAESPTTGVVRASSAATDAVQLLDEVPLTEAEAEYVEAARAANTLRGYRSDWTEFATWCTQHDRDPLPASASTITGYLSDLAKAGAKVGTMSRRLSALKFVHQLQDLPDPTANARVVAVWEGIRRTHGAPPDQASPLMPPELFDVLTACPTTKTWKTKGKAPEPDLAGHRDRALLLVGFVGALRRSELAALHVEHVDEHPNGLVLSLPRSKTNQHGTEAELVVLPRSGNPDRCPVTTLRAWLKLADIATQLQAARLMTYWAAAKADSGGAGASEASGAGGGRVINLGNWRFRLSKQRIMFIAAAAAVVAAGADEILAARRGKRTTKPPARLP